MTENKLFYYYQEGNILDLKTPVLDHLLSPDTAIPTKLRFKISDEGVVIDQGLSVSTGVTNFVSQEQTIPFPTEGRDIKYFLDKVRFVRIFSTTCNPDEWMKVQPYHRVV